MRAKAIFDGAWNTKALTHYFYDNLTESGNIPVYGVNTTGDLTLVRAYYDLPPSGSITSTPANTILIHGTDTRYGYD